MTTGRAALYTASAFGFALVARSLTGARVPLWLALLAFLGYLALLTAGVLVPRLQMFAEVVYRGPAGARGVALTFDDGPHPEHTRAVLDVLDDAGAKATFFVLGEKAVRHADVVREIARRGHLVGIHGDTHDRVLSFRSLDHVRRDLSRALHAVSEVLGERPRHYRPAVGQTNPRIARAADELGLVIVGWSVRGRDGVRADPEAVAARVVRGLSDGAVVLLHDAAERDDREPAAPRALPAILEAMRLRGLSGVRLDGW
jgi:peptidoglycan/xylan/chitin deacetylase (PgdA/CDA1 family)